MNDAEKLSGQGDEGLASAAPSFHSLIKAPQIETVSGCDQCRLHQSRAAEFGPTLMDASRMFGLVGVRHPRHDAEVTGQALLVGKIFHLANHAQQNGTVGRADPFNDQIGVALQFRAGLGDRLLQLRDALLQAANLIGDHPQFEQNHRIEGQRQYLCQSLLAR
jgi:hypothetical protein